MKEVQISKQDRDKKDKGGVLKPLGWEQNKISTALNIRSKKKKRKMSKTVWTEQLDGRAEQLYEIENMPQCLLDTMEQDLVAQEIPYIWSSATGCSQSTSYETTMFSSYSESSFQEANKVGQIHYSLVQRWSLWPKKGPLKMRV